MGMSLAPFWRYYGGKNRAARLYPQPEHDTIIEPFAGAAGYSCRYPARRVILVDKSPIIAGIWRYLIGTPASEILALPDIPEGGTVDDLDVCQEARWLVGFWCNSATVTPCKKPTSWITSKTTPTAGWGAAVRCRIAEQVKQIRHWTIIEGEYHDAPNIEATWHIDPPYDNKAGRLYPQQPEAFEELSEWCRTRRGLVMVCENHGADWLPFHRLAATQSNAGERGKKKSQEVIWLNRAPRLTWGVQTSLFGEATWV
jgi:hypothetical protein